LSEKIFDLPDVGEGLVEAEIVTWKVAVGDVVELNQPLVDIETAKAVVELPSPFAGTVITLHANVGDVVEVDKPLVTFEVAGDAPTPTLVDDALSIESTPEARREAVLVGYGVSSEEAVITRTHRRQVPGAPAPISEVRATTPVASGVAATSSPRSTPPVRLYAKQHGLDLSTVAATGRDGVITRDDVDRALRAVPASGPSGVAPQRAAPTGPNVTSRFIGRDLEAWSTGPLEERIPVKGVLRSMSDAMTQSALNIPRAAVWNRVDATRTVELLESLKRQPGLSGVRLSPLMIIALAVCDAVRHFPGVNSNFDVANGEVVIRRTVNLGIAADTPRGLVVPNIKGADRMDLVEMAQSLTALVEKARSGTTTPNEMLGTSISITNVGPFGVDAALPIIPPGTGAIVGVGQIARRPWVVGDVVVPRHVVEITLAFDHRHIDGALASQVIAHIGRYLEDPAPSIIAG
jgi:pyruvate dehydrogenase E2 component (dihydrolipoamide acetyltransferase)